MQQTQQGQHWLDKVVQGIEKWQTKNNIEELHVDDMKTPSGRVHTGALRGVLLHDLVHKALQAKKANTVNTYVFNNMDVMDGLPAYLNKSVYEKHMGKPLYKIPAPPLEESGIDFSNATEAEKEKYRNAKNFAEFYALDFIDAFSRLGATPKVVWSHELYESGQMDEVIRIALDNVDEIKRIYKEVADYKLPDQWYPFQALCPQCGKMGTTLTTGWDGKVVTFECQPNKVTWAVGCGYKGSVSPFGGTGKFLWKVDWPAHWTVMGVNVEGAGKDHTSAGGSRDMANQLITKVFKKISPFDIPYEWILIRGAKMSSSKGVGTSAREFVELFPAEVGRFLFASRNYNQVIDFDPQTMAIPDLFDDYDMGARIYWKQEEGDHRLARSFELSQLSAIPQPHFLPRFRDVATWMQHPELNLEEKFAAIKGSALTTQEKEVLHERQTYAQIWVDRYAPEEFQLTPKADLPIQASELTAEQKDYLETIITHINNNPNLSPEDLQQYLFDTAKTTLGPKKGFEAIYLAFLGKKAGPRAAWFLQSIDSELRTKRIQQITEEQNNSQNQNYIFETLKKSEFFSISDEVKKKFPSITVGLAVIRGTSINKTNPDLEKEKQSILSTLESLTTEDINGYSEVQSYRQIMKETGVDWHSRRPSPEALLRRIAQKKGLYEVNTCVDAYNLVVLKHRVSVGAFDLKQVQFPTQLQLAEGGEHIHLLGDKEDTVLEKNEICYFDQTGPYNLDFNYRDAQRTMVTEKTTDILINVEGVYSITRSQVEQSLQEVIAIIQKYCGGTLEFAGIVESQD